MELKDLKQHVRTLAALEEADAFVVSCYLNFKTGARDARDFFYQQAAALTRGLGRDAIRRQLEPAMNQVETYLSSDLARDVKGVAVFARAGRQPLFLSLQFRVPIPNWMAVDSTPSIYPLVELKDAYHRYVVMLCAEQSMRVLEVNVGSVTADVWKERPELKKRVGREWTDHQYHSHRRACVDRLIKEGIRVLNQTMGAGGYKHLILAGNPRMTARVGGALPKALADRVVGAVAASGRDRASDIVEATLTAFVQEEQRESLSMVARLQREIQRGGLAQAGVASTLSALKRGQVDVLLLAKGHDCTAREELIHLAERGACEIEVVKGSEVLVALGGVGCLLRYRLPESRCSAPATLQRKKERSDRKTIGNRTPSMAAVGN